MNRIEVVCKRNLVRSPFLASFLQMHFPDFLFSSSGLDANDELMYDAVAHNVARSWGFPYLMRRSKEFNSKSSGMTYLATDLELKLRIDSLGLVNEVISLKTESFQDLFQKPIDPVGLNEFEMKQQLARLLFYGVETLWGVEKRSSINRITTLVPKTAKSYEQLFSDIDCGIYGQNIQIVDACLKSTNFLLFKNHGFEAFKYYEAPKIGAAFTIPFETLESEAMLCSLTWRNWLMQLQKHGDVLVISPPLKDSSENLIYDSILASIWSNEVLLVE